MTLNEACDRWSELINERLDSVEKEASLSETFRLITRGGDRHGALEWTYYSQDAKGDGMDLLVSIAVFPHASWGVGTFEFWFGGRLGDRYGRHLASTLKVLIDEPDWRSITAALADAAAQAHAVTESDLSDVLPVAPF
ncbi:hypothetical protein [Streptomyces adonidis]|uniref:hypothetical protein n=1 Tax=Streptomyces adonidis TaxID=3231367 RepID=UPI0034DB12D8